MITENELKQLAQACAVTLPASDLMPGPSSDQPESEKDLMLCLAERLGRDGVAMSFFAAGAYNFYQPVALAYPAQNLCLDWYQVQGAALQAYRDIKKHVELRLARLLAIDQAVVEHKEPVTVLSDLLTRLYSLQAVAGMHKRKVILPSSMPPVIRHALRTLLKYQSLDSVVIDFDKASGRITMAQLNGLDDDVLALVFSYPNFFGVIEDVALITGWAQQHRVKTIVLANALVLTFIKSPAQLGEQVDFVVADLQPLGLPVNRKGNAPVLLAGTETQLERINNNDVSFTLFNDMVKIQGFLTGQSTQQLQQCYLQAHSNLNELVKGLTGIENISLRFTATSLNECVIHLDKIDLERALQILAGHNILAGYPLVEDYPELDGCLLIHCTDQHDKTEIERFIQKMATVVKNLSTASCPVKPKFT